MKLLGPLPLAKFGWDSSSFNDLDAMITDPVAGSHLVVHLLNTTIQSGITVLLVHVVIPSSTLIPQPDAIILDLGWVLLKNLQVDQITCKGVMIKEEKFPTAMEAHAEMRLMIKYKDKYTKHDSLLMKISCSYYRPTTSNNVI